MTVFRRRPGAASVAALAGIALSVVAAPAVAPDWSRRAGLDAWGLAAAETECRAEADRRAELLDIHARMNEQIRATDAVVAEWVAGRTQLAAAIDEVGRINADRPGFIECLRCDWPRPASDRDAVARYLLGKARRQLADDPSLTADALPRLEAEYRAMEK